jgi:hypothetical protein
MHKTLEILLVVLISWCIAACGANGDDSTGTMGDGDGNSDNGAQNGGEAESEGGANSDGRAKGEWEDIEKDVATEGDGRDEREGDEGPPYCLNADGVMMNDCAPCLPNDLAEDVKRALKHMFPDADSVVLVGEETTYFVAEREGQLIGTAFFGEGVGYEGVLTCLTGVDVGRRVIRVQLVHSDPHEYTHLLRLGFWNQFSCLELSSLDIPGRSWGGNAVDAVTRATWTSNAVFESVWNALDTHHTVFGH